MCADFIVDLIGFSALFCGKAAVGKGRSPLHVGSFGIFAGLYGTDLLFDPGNVLLFSFYGIACGGRVMQKGE